MDRAGEDGRDDLARIILSDLSVPFDPALKRQRTVQGPHGPRQLDYYDLMTVVDRLNAVAPGWNCAVKSQDIRPFGQTNRGTDDRLMLIAVVSLYIPGVGTREHMGVQVVNATSGGEDMWKGAISDAIKKAATLFGVGRELYGEDPVSAPAPSAAYGVTQGVNTQAPVVNQRPPQQQQQQGGGPLISDQQIGFIYSLAFERGLPYSEVTNIGNMSRQDASRYIDQLMPQQRLRQLQRGESPPNWWFAGENEPPF